MNLDALLAQPLLAIGMVLFGLGVVLAAAASISFRWRAITNERAWGGIAVPAGVSGTILLIVGVALIGLHLAGR